MTPAEITTEPITPSALDSVLGEPVRLRFPDGYIAVGTLAGYKVDRDGDIAVILAGHELGYDSGRVTALDVLR